MMQDTKIEEFKSFDELYDKILSLGILPRGEPSQNKFGNNTPHALRNLWSNLFHAQPTRNLL